MADHAQLVVEGRHHVEGRLVDHKRGPHLPNGAWSLMLRMADAIESLQRERDEARAGAALVTDEREDVVMRLDRAEAQLARQRKVIEALSADLQRYGRHTGTCNQPGYADCNCGWEQRRRAALSEIGTGRDERLAQADAVINAFENDEPLDNYDALVDEAIARHEARAATVALAGSR